MQLKDYILMRENMEIELGELPWSEELLKRAYFNSFIKTREAIKKHPGYYYHKMLLDEQGYLKIFTKAVEDLNESVASFHRAYDQEKLYYRHKQELLDQYVIEVTNNMILCAGSAMAMVDWSRRIQEHAKIPEHDAYIKKVFDNNPEHRFIQNLRNAILHGYFVTADWQRLHSKDEVQSIFLLKKERLLEFGKWHALSKKFMEDNLYEIDIVKLFATYKGHVLNFHEWYSASINAVFDSLISEYRYYEGLLNQFGSRTEWRVILQQALARNIDPYLHISERLSENELKEVNALPQHSKDQIDKIIEIFDEYNACDDELRNMVYRLFRLKSTDD